jgi:hypothetical protein
MPVVRRGDAGQVAVGEDLLRRDIALAAHVDDPAGGQVEEGVEEIGQVWQDLFAVQPRLQLAPLVGLPLQPFSLRAPLEMPAERLG